MMQERGSLLDNTSIFVVISQLFLTLNPTYFGPHNRAEIGENMPFRLSILLESTSSIIYSLDTTIRALEGS